MAYLFGGKWGSFSLQYTQTNKFGFMSSNNLYLPLLDKKFAASIFYDFKPNIFNFNKNTPMVMNIVGQ